MSRALTILGSVALAAAAAAQPAPLDDPLLDRMVGTWVLSGTIAGKPTTHDVTFEWVLGHQYLQMGEASREKGADGGPAYQAIVLIGWDAKAKAYACLWLDNTAGGGLAVETIGRGRRTGDDVAFLFKGGDGSTFHTTFAYDRAADAWQWLMDGEEGGKLQPFARVRLTRR